jgi:hypothetical protein
VLTLSVARALFALCAVACVGGALLLPSVAVAGERHAVTPENRHRAEIIPAHRGVLARGGLPVIPHEPALTPELVDDHRGEREPVSFSRDGWLRSIGAWARPTIGVSEAALAMLYNPPPAQGAASLVGGCVGGDYAVSCAMQWGPPVNPFVRIVPPPADPAEQANATARDRRWVAYCKPFVVEDTYGVPRYHYAQAGCEFGALGN